MDDIKQRRKRSRKDLQAKRLYFCLSRTEWKASAVKRHVTPPPWLMVQELLSLQLRFLDQRRGQAYSESKSPSDTLHVTRLISSSAPHRKRIRHLRLYFGLPGYGQLECCIKRRDHLGPDRQWYRNLL